jgi:cytochrome c oxidase cbb3-type subunit 3
MSQFTSGFWDVYIAVVTVVSIVACAVFLKVQSVRKTVEADTTGHVWDENLQEYNNPMPRWWAWLFYATVAFGLGYLVLYPGLGSYQGALGWSQVGQLNEETKEANARFGPLYDKYARLGVAEVAKSPEALAIGQKLFLNHCAQCHASDARGSRDFPNLTDNDWLWGGTPEAIETSITAGRLGVMPPFGAVLGEEGTRDVANYVLSLSGSPHDAARAARGKETAKAIRRSAHRISPTASGCTAPARPRSSGRSRWAGRARCPPTRTCSRRPRSTC